MLSCQRRRRSPTHLRSYSRDASTALSRRSGPDTSGISQPSLWRSRTMPVVSRRTVAALAAFLGLLGVLSFAVQSRAATDNNNLVQALRAGHGATFPDQADTDPLNFDNIAAQRNLNDKRKASAKAFGDALRQVGVPVGKVYTS